MTRFTTKLSVWHSCYDSQWKGMITNESFAHPAKFSRGLIERIYDYCLAWGYLKPNDLCGDCFGGIGTGGIIAAYKGLRWVGVELEPRFVGMAENNFQLHRQKLSILGRSAPVILQGDSRRFDEIIKSVMAIVSSPPYADSLNKDNHIDWDKAASNGKDTGAHSQSRNETKYGHTSGQIGKLGAGNLDAAISSPPYATIAAGAGGLNSRPARKPGQQSGRNAKSASQTGNWSKDLLRYGKTDGQISQTKDGSLDAAITSPPWEKNAEGARKAGKFKDSKAILKNKRGNGASDAAVLAQASRDELKVYGESPGQIGKLSGGTIDATVTSPPYGQTMDHGGGPDSKQDHIKGGKSLLSIKDGYGNSKGQINGRPETYWQAMSDVYRSCFHAIKPGGYMVLVVKDYVRKKKRVTLCDDTCRLIEHIGFQVVERIQAMLVKETSHGDLFTGSTVEVKSRKSFFRRLAENKGSPKIDYEEVIIAQRL